MGVRIGLSFLIILGSSRASTDARNVLSYDVLTDRRNEEVCTFCEQYVSEALPYLGENKTQTEIIGSLHQACSRLRTFQRECTTLVDYFAPLFFLEVARGNPENFCRILNLCEVEAAMSLQQHQDACDLCHQALSQVLNKLRDPDTQLDIIEALVKECDRLEKYAKRCKKLVFEYGPVILANAEQYLEANDLCTVLHICRSTKTGEKSVAEV